MLYYVLISIVILAELIIAAEVIGQLSRWDRIFRNANIFLDEAKPKIKDIAQIALKISEQLTELSPIWVKKFNDNLMKLFINNIQTMLLSILLYSIKSKFLTENKKN